MIKKAIIPIAGLGTRFLPLSTVIPKELFPLVDKPAIQYIIEEAKASGIQEIIFIVSPKKKEILDYFKENPELEKTLKSRNKEGLLKELQKTKEILKGVSFLSVSQPKPLGDGHAILQAKKLIGKDPCGVFFADDIIDSKIPCFLQLTNIFRTSQAPIIGLKKVSDDKIPNYGIVEVEKISSRLYKVKKVYIPVSYNFNLLSSISFWSRYSFIRTSSSPFPLHLSHLNSPLRASQNSQSQ